MHVGCAPPLHSAFPALATRRLRSRTGGIGWLSSIVAGGGGCGGRFECGVPGRDTNPARLSVAQLLAGKKARPVRSLDELAADTFDSDEDLRAFLSGLYASRRAGSS
jgi:hypothetical protein